MKKQWFTVKKIRPQLYALAEFGHFEKVVSYLVVGKTEAFLVDTGMGYTDIHKAIKAITKLPVTVLLTHAHWDHIGGVKKADRVYVFDHPFEKKSITQLHNNYVSVQDRQILKIGNYTVKVIHTPGHSPGSTCYFIKNLNWLFVGDTLYPGPLYAHLPESDLYAYTKSLARLCLVANNQTLILPGHNKLHCSYALLKKAAVLMKKAVRTKKMGISELKGDGFSILLSKLGKSL